MAYLNDRVLDYGLNEIYTNGTRLDICTDAPTTYAEIATYSCGYKTSLPVGAPQAGATSGRRVIISAFTDGVGTVEDTADYYAISDPVNGRLLATNTITTPIDAEVGEAFSFPQFEICFPGV